MTTPQHPERGDAVPEKPDDEKSPAEPLESAGTDWATPAAGEPWESAPVEPAAPLPAGPAAPDIDAQPSGAEPAAPTPAERAAAETAPDLVAQPQPWNAGDQQQAQPSGTPNQSRAQPEPWHPAAGAQYERQPYPPGAVYPPITDKTPESPYGGYPPYTPQPYSTPEPRSGTQTLSIIAFVCAGISLLFCPYLFGPAGIILGLIAHNKGESLGKWAAIVSALTLIIGLILAYAVFSGSMIPDSN
ncbi:hypothetical protein OG874_29380 [Nocardia sp. NBC_00565]|uniref:hypothetical protein n=1 Tax=Nocardia sp. NBC_00565 TaxID=2975993 RepID=UPI002E7FBD9E|nr:hypothetical protein [Nocardia sp. NBC_00565]WUC00928.1 hypothetical protein OG874_29380 [Nocardia sp. NBC_00565]